MGGKVKYHLMSEKDRMKCLGDFYDAVSSLKSREEAKRFFKDLLTLSEVVMLSRRIQVAKKLLGGETIDDIRKELKVGLDTINSVEKWLNNGFGGYKEIIERIRKNEKRIKSVKRYYGSNILNRYPQHRWLVNLLK